MRRNLALIMTLLALTGLGAAPAPTPAPAPAMATPPAAPAAAPAAKPAPITTTPAGPGRVAVTPREPTGLAQVDSLPGRRKVPLTLQEAVRIGLTQNVEVRKSLLDRAVQRIDLSLAERLFEPEFYLKGGYAYDAATTSDTRSLGFEIYNRIITAGELKFDWTQSNVLNRETGRENNPSNLTVSLRQPLLRGAGVTVGTADLVTAQNSEAINRLAFDQLVIDRITSVQEAYWNLLLALENRLSAVRSLQASQDIRQRNQALIAAGRMPAADLVQAEQEVAARQVDVLDQEFAAQTANQALVLLLDLDENVGILPIEGMVYRPVSVSYAAMAPVAMQHNRRLEQARVQVRQSELDLKVARSNALDQVDLVLGANVVSDNENLGRAADQAWDLGQGFNAGLGFTVPLGLPRDRLRQQVRVAAKNLAQAKLDLHQATLTVRQDVQDRANDVARSLRQIGLAQTSRELARQKYEIELARLELGRSSNFQVLSYQRDLTQARDAEHRSIVNYLNSLARLDAVVGTSLDTWNVRVEEPALPLGTRLDLQRLGREPAPGPAAPAPATSTPATATPPTTAPAAPR